MNNNDEITSLQFGRQDIANVVEDLCGVGGEYERSEEAQKRLIERCCRALQEEGYAEEVGEVVKTFIKGLVTTVIKTEYINGHRELAEWLGVVYRNYSDNLEQELNSYAYSNTGCGAWGRLFNDGVQFGTIVEGSDAEFACDKLTYPFHKDEIHQCLEWLEGEVNSYFREQEDDELEPPDKEPYHCECYYCGTVFTTEVIWNDRPWCGCDVG